MSRLIEEFVASTMLGALAVSIGLVLLITQRKTRTNIGSASVSIAVGLAVLTVWPLVDAVDPNDPALGERFQIVFEVAAVVASALYLQGLCESARSVGTRAETVIRACVRASWVLAGLLLAAGAAFPAERLNDFQQSVGTSSDPLSTRGFWLFAALWLAVALVFSVGWLMMVQQHLDPGEHARALCNMVSSPLLVATVALPSRLALASVCTALVTFLFGQFRYLVSEGERGAFLSRFLSPQVAEQVRVGGLTTVMQPGEAVLTVVACDLRGFTAYAEGVPSQAVIDLLGEYYETVGAAVAEVDGTIKDYAGDGILILIGAPLPHPDHAAAGLRLARRIHQVTRPVLDRWATEPHPLGIGVGVAGGRVTVGAIGSDARMEYTAVGTPVNLAARLCSAASDGEILIDQRTRAAADGGVESRGEMPIKGMSRTVPVFAYSVADPITEPIAEGSRK